MRGPPVEWISAGSVKVQGLKLEKFSTRVIIPPDLVYPSLKSDICIVALMSGQCSECEKLLRRFDCMIGV